MKFLENLAIFLIMVTGILAGLAIIVFFGFIIISVLSGIAGLIF